VRRSFDGLHGLRLVALDGDDRAGRREHFGQEQRAADDLGGVLAHQHVVAADVRLAFRAIDDQRLAGNGRRELVGRRINGTAQADDAAGADCRKLLGDVGRPRRRGGGRHALVTAVGFDDDT
jgi:hypothetical protein